MRLLFFVLLSTNLFAQTITKATYLEGGLYKEASFDNQIGSLKTDDTVIVYSFQDPFLKVKYKNTDGYIGIGSIEMTHQIRYIIADGTKDPRRATIIRNHGFENLERLYNKKPWIGMTKDEFLISFGAPEKTNRTTTSNVVSEQLVYPDYKYYYFDNGKLTAMQD